MNGHDTFWFEALHEIHTIFHEDMPTGVAFRKRAPLFSEVFATLGPVRTFQISVPEGIERGCVWRQSVLEVQLQHRRAEHHKKFCGVSSNLRQINRRMLELSYDPLPIFASNETLVVIHPNPCFRGRVWNA